MRKAKKITSSSQSIQYQIGVDDWRGHRFDVTMLIPAGVVKTSYIDLQLPAWIPGSYMIRDFSKHLECFSVGEGCKNSDSGSASKPVAFEKIDSHTWRVYSNRSLRVSYQVYAFDTSVRAAYLDRHRAFFNASSVCLQVMGAQPLYELNLLPPKQDDLVKMSTWSVETTLPAQKTNHHGFGTYQAVSYDELIDHPVAMGEFQIITWQAHGTPHRMVIQGLLDPVDGQQLSQDLKAICEAHIAFFEPDRPKAPFKQYTFMVNAVGDGYGGLEHRDSTVLLCKRDDLPYPGQNLKKHSGYEDFLGLCSHEYFHAWMVKRIKPKVFDPYVLNQKNHTRLLWLFEGFTSYYDDLQLFRSKRIDLKAYLKRIEKTWNMVLRGPGRHKQSLSESSFDAWTKYYQMDENTPNAVVSYYAKGSLLALGLDLKIREHTQQQQSLDDVIRHLWQMYQLTDAGMAEDDFDHAIEFVIGSGFMKTWQFIKRNYLDGVDDVPLENWLSEAGIQVAEKPSSHEENAEVAKQLLGIRTTVHQGWVKLTHVLDGGLAQSAGLSAGDIVSSINQERLTPSRLDSLLVQLIQKLLRKQSAPICAYRHEQELRLTISSQKDLLIYQPKQYALSV
jgi:predicted metalloprotease with PDZ domain